MAKARFSLRDRQETRASYGNAAVRPTIDIDDESPEWEAICRRCGECCFERTYDHDDTLLGSTICEFLDPVTRLCNVYERRFEVCHDCIKLTAENLLTFDWLPDTCGYVVRFGIRRNKGKK
jgi:uncharacterized cysteine cluster protein YcgN (CxxCxxCC family)